MNSLPSVIMSEPGNVDEFNYLPLKIPGLQNMIDIPFPNGALPVCQQCKKGFNAKKKCRDMRAHPGLPWCDTFVCITLDPTCFHGNSLKLNSIWTAQVTEARNDLSFIDPVDKNIPSCAACKDSKVLRKICRETLSHRRLPCCTSYVTLKALPTGQVELESCDESSESPLKKHKAVSTSDCDNYKSDALGNDIVGVQFFEHVHESRSFLYTFSVKDSSMEWVRTDDTVEPVRSIKARTRKPKVIALAEACIIISDDECDGDGSDENEL